jgi:hypothetical protein
MDQTWIEMVYRPYFGKNSPLASSLKARIMDRALQFSLDKDRREDRELVAHVVQEVARCDLGFDIEFIDKETLRQWHGVVLDMMNASPDWERFRHGVRRHIGSEEVDSDEFEEIVRAVPDLVDETIRYLTPQLIDTALNASLERSIVSVREYLQCA